jgi:cell wall-associated NlpC family hydrolase
MKTSIIYILFFFISSLLLTIKVSAQTSLKKDSITSSISKAKLDFKVHTDSLPQNNSAYVDNMLGFAKTFLGTPYLSSGASPTGFDCSGFVSYVLGNFGLDVIHSSYGLAEYGRTVKLSEAKPGDLMFFKGSNSGSSRIGHVAIIYEVNPTEGIKFIHASSSKGITIDRFNGSAYYVPRYVTTKRLDYGVESQSSKSNEEGLTFD